MCNWWQPVIHPKVFFDEFICLFCVCACNSIIIFSNRFKFRVFCYFISDIFHTHGGYSLIACKRIIYLATYSRIDRRHATRIPWKRYKFKSNHSFAIFKIYTRTERFHQNRRKKKHLLIVLPLCLYVIRATMKLSLYIFLVRSLFISFIHVRGERNYWLLSPFDFCDFVNEIHTFTISHFVCFVCTINYDFPLKSNCST